jgi:hypothetical protein
MVSRGTEFFGDTFLLSLRERQGEGRRFVRRLNNDRIWRVSAPARTSSAVDSDMTCARCDYNLRTLPLDGNCPECGLSVTESIDKNRR